MAERIAAADGDHYEPRANGGHKPRCRCVPGSKMADLERVGANIIAGGQESTFTCFARVAHEYFTKAALLKHDDNAILVHVVARVDQKRQRRRENLKRYTVARPSLHPTSRENHPYSMRARGRDAIAIRAPAVVLARIVEYADRQRIDDLGTSADMIAVRI
jgi:hypothetical protein